MAYTYDLHAFSYARELAIPVYLYSTCKCNVVTLAFIFHSKAKNRIAILTIDTINTNVIYGRTYTKHCMAKINS